MTPIINMHNFFDALPSEVRQAMEEISVWREAPRGAVLVQAGAVQSELQQLCEGRAKYCYFDQQGREKVAMPLRPGDWIGVSEMFTGLPTLSNVVAQSPARLRAIRHDAFEALMARYPAILRELMRIQSLRFSALHYLSLERETLNLKERLLKTLHALALSQQGSPEQGVSIHMPQIELSRMLAVSRPKLNQALKELEKEGLLTVHYGSICLHRPTDLPSAYSHLLAMPQPAPAPQRAASARPQRVLS